MNDQDLSHWKGVSYPKHEILEGNYVRLEPLEDCHAEALYKEVDGADKEARFHYLHGTEAPLDFEDMKRWVETWKTSRERLYFAVVNKTTHLAEGYFSLMRIDTDNGVIEIGAVLWGRSLVRTHRATEAVFLAASYIFDLGYRRFEWKCDNLNLPSKKAAERFGFLQEGLFRQHIVSRGNNRDTAWFSMLDKEWPEIKKEYERWLDPNNFTEEGKQKTSLNVKEKRS
ncbi:GNAT family N-acetyltransferase [Acetobacteraceae bacterium]|nr:GNAT family N-acetyltransferase [Acetobacteraceae bacterium]